MWILFVTIIIESPQCRKCVSALLRPTVANAQRFVLGAFFLTHWREIMSFKRLTL